jgi:regulator of sirC expression with transglutaminase-like and TPR domain
LFLLFPFAKGVLYDEGMTQTMTHNQESLRILRRAGERPDRDVNLGETALALAAFNRPKVKLESYRQHLAEMVEQVRAAGKKENVEDQLNTLRRVLVVQNKYQGDDEGEHHLAAHNLIDVITSRRGSALALCILYLHVAHHVGWAMAALDLSGHLLLRLSARDGQVIIDPFRSGQTCQIEEASNFFLEEEDEDDIDPELLESAPLDIYSDLLRPLSSRDLLLQLQHTVKQHYLADHADDHAIAILQGMILLAPRQQELWKELGYLQADRGQLRAAISALEVVKDLSSDPVPAQHADVVLRELRWRLN